MTDPQGTTINIVGVLLAGAGMALVSLMETALLSVNDVRLRQLAQQGSRAARLVELMRTRPDNMLGALIIMINALVLLAANLTTIEARARWGAAYVPLADVVVLIALLVFSEIIPKTFSVSFAESIALRTAYLAYALHRLLSPLVTVLNGVSFGLLRALTALRLLSGRIHAEPVSFSEEDIKQLLTAGEESGEVEAVEREMIHGVIEFADTTAHEFMVPRTDLVALPSDASLEEAIQTFLDSGHSRIPVYEENADNILGLLYVKDVLIRLTAAEEHNEPPPTLAELLRPAFFVPESKKCDELLREMQRRQVHMAVVVDEYGGTAGIITIENLLEEIVGDIVDEYDRERPEVMRQPDGSYLLSGQMNLGDVEDTFHTTIPEDTESETIGGLLTEQLGRIPLVDDSLTLGNVEFTVTEAAHNRVERLRAVIKPAGKTPEG